MTQQVPSWLGSSMQGKINENLVQAPDYSLSECAAGCAERNCEALLYPRKGKGCFMILSTHAKLDSRQSNPDDVNAVESPERCMQRCHVDLNCLGVYFAFSRTPTM